MCGIAGIYAFTDAGREALTRIDTATSCMKSRGPDGSGSFRHNNVALGHARLAVIDTSSAASQPMTDISGRFTIIFNGEIFNYREHRNALLAKGISLRTHSD